MIKQTKPTVAFELLVILLTLLFVTLKRIGTIQWTWWWVLSPIWISAGGISLTILLIFVVSCIVGMCQAARKIFGGKK